MYNWFSKAAALVGVVAISLTSCKKDETQATLKVGPAPQLTASVPTAVLTGATAADKAVMYTWTAADYGFQAAVTYTLQFSKHGTNFATTQDFILGNALTKTLTGKELNDIYNALDCNINSSTSSTPLDVRVKAMIGDAIPPVLSNTAGISAVPYQAQTPPADTWGIIGSATADTWNSDQNMTYDFCTRTYRASIPLTISAGNDEIKFRANDAWTLNYGDDGADGTLEAGGANIKVTGTTGTYDIVLNLNATPKPTYTITKH